MFSLVTVMLVSACGTTEPPVTAVLPTATANPPTATAEPPKDPKILFIGDSYTDGMNDFITGLAASSDPPLIIEADQVTFGNTSLHFGDIGLALKQFLPFKKESGPLLCYRTILHITTMRWNGLITIIANSMKKSRRLARRQCFTLPGNRKVRIQ